MTDAATTTAPRPRGIDLTPTWRGVLPILLTTLDHANNGGVAIAKAELERMADAADRYNANVCLPAATVRALVEAARSYADDLSTGLDDGTYDEDPGLEALEAALEAADAVLAAKGPHDEEEAA